ncbi:MAG: pyruvate ferredoxin oxidoreductase, partial [Bacillota bacterium]
LVINLKNLKVIGVMDRATDFSRNGGALYTDIHSALADTASELQFINYIYGLGGRDIKVSELVAIYEQLLGAAGGEQTVEQINYWGVRQ